MTLSLLTAVLVAALLAGVAEAVPARPPRPPPRIDAVGELPCTRGELAEAIALRVDAAEVRVEVAGERVVIHVGDRARSIALDGARGRAAARLIALAAADLSMGELALAPPAPMVAATAPAPAIASSVRTPRRFDVAVTARAGTSAALRGGLAIGATFGAGRWRPAVEAGIAGGLGNHDVALVGAPVRAGVAWGDDAELRLTALGIPYVARGGAGDAGVLAGAGLEGRGYLRAGGATIVLAAGIDALANQVEYRYAGDVALTTPRVQVWTVVGLAWGVQ